MKTSHTISLLSTIGMISNAKLVPNGRNSTQIDNYCPQLFRGELPHSGSCFGLWLVLPLFIQCSKLLIGKICVCVCVCVCVLVAQLFFATPWTVALQAPWCVGFPRQEYWSGLPFPSPGDLPHPGIEPGSLALQVDSLPFEPPGKPCVCVCVCVCVCECVCACVCMKCLPLMSL